MTALSKLNDMTSIIKNGGHFLISEGLFNKGGCNEMFEEKVVQEVLRNCFNRSGEMKKFFTKIKWNHQNMFKCYDFIYCTIIFNLKNVVGLCQK